MPNKQEQIDSLLESLYFAAENMRPRDGSGFAKECHELVEGSYKQFFKMIEGKKIIDVNQLYTLMAIADGISRDQLLGSAAKDEHESAGDTLYQQVKSSKFYQFLQDKGIVDHADDDVFEHSVDHPVSFNDYIAKRDDLQREYLQYFKAAGVETTEIAEELQNFDLYFKMQIMNEDFYVETSEKIFEWMDTHATLDAPVKESPANTVKGDNKAAFRLHSQTLGQEIDIRLN